jgi:xylose isomerase
MAKKEKKLDVGYYKSFLGMKRQLEEQIARGNYAEAKKIVEQLQEVATRAMEDTGDKTLWGALNKMLEDPRYMILEQGK